ncbi:MAG: 5-oxoprolinase subunit PxpB [Deltaproteobacteria bacterium]|nr:5-oxoprolinase subunit PxpB [Deltaproteobacteria bacterium]MBW2649778.1 5-oxoprolinase subunit PxpB [Deltaproteobacteria bacterium]
MSNGLYETPKIRVVGDRGLLVEYGDRIDPVVNQKVISIAIGLEHDAPAGVIEIIPSYRSLMIVYDPSVTTTSVLQESLSSLEKRLPEIEIPTPQTVEIPVCYGGEFGPDIQFVAENHGLTVDEVIRIHSEPEYQIFMIGFTPGFPYLGGLPKELHTPRKKTPRAQVLAGSVGIANEQTGIYPVTSPGGWQLIGRTPVKLFDLERPNPFLYQAGDRIKFNPISLEEYRRLAEKGIK